MQRIFVLSIPSLGSYELDLFRNRLSFFYFRKNKEWLNKAIIKQYCRFLILTVFDRNVRGGGDVVSFVSLKTSNK